MCCLLCSPFGDHTGSPDGPGSPPRSSSDNSNSGCFCLRGGFFFAGGSSSLEVSEEDDDDAALEGFFCPSSFLPLQTLHPSLCRFLNWQANFFYT